ncbi:hypothetical protein PInf_027881 [Phytophthora infestans]|nr:hypothetical protein PInf_027881 [Phytophthora infestans]
MNQFTLVAVTAVLVALYHNYFAPQPAVWVAPSQLKLTYFAGPGRAELSRLILSAGNVAFEDQRLDRDAFLAIKPTLPLGQPEYGHRPLRCQTHGLYPQDPLECLRVDMVSESLVDVKTLISEIAYRTPDEAAKTEKTKKLLEESKGPFFLGDKMTYGDLQLYDLTKNGLGNFAGFSLSKYPKLTTLVSKVESNPNVAAYLVKHQQLYPLRNRDSMMSDIITGLRHTQSSLQIRSTPLNPTTMTQPQLKLTYFDGKGRAELPRLIFNYAGIAFTDDRITHSDFAALKPTLPFGQVPVLELDARFTPRAGLSLATLPRSLACIRVMRPSSEVHPGDKLSFADLQFLDFVDNKLKWAFLTSRWTASPKLTALLSNVKAEPKIATYLSKQ